MDGNDNKPIAPATPIESNSTFCLYRICYENWNLIAENVPIFSHALHELMISCQRASKDSKGESESNQVQEDMSSCKGSIREGAPARGGESARGRSNMAIV